MKLCKTTGLECADCNPVCEHRKKIELKPCPFCGGNTDIEEIDDSYYIMSCKSCGAGTTFTVNCEDGWREATLLEAIENWNRREIE